MRKEGDSDDAYEVFARLGAENLDPSKEDYALLAADVREAASRALGEEIRKVMAELVEHARREPETLHHADIHDANVGMAVVYQAGEYRVLIVPTLTLSRRPISQEMQVLVIDAVFEGIPLDQLDFPEERQLQRVVGYELRAGEFAVAKRVTTR